MNTKICCYLQYRGGLRHLSDFIANTNPNVCQENITHTITQPQALIQGYTFLLFTSNSGAMCRSRPQDAGNQVTFFQSIVSRDFTS